MSCLVTSILYFNLVMYLNLLVIYCKGAAREGGTGSICPGPRVGPLECGEKKGIQCHKSKKTNILNLWCKHRNSNFVTRSSREVLIKDLRRKGPLHFFALGPKISSCALDILNAFTNFIQTSKGFTYNLQLNK